MKKKAVVCINIGTPKSPSVKDVRRYLKEFLSDPRVLNIPYLSRQLLLGLFILPFRSPKSAKAYASIWSDKGSPLLSESESFCEALSEALGEGVSVRVAMRYGEPSLCRVLEEVKSYEEVILFPLYPQYASSSSGSSLEACFRFFSRQINVPAVQTVSSFYKEAGFIRSLGETVREAKREGDWDHLLMSYHGLPESQVRASEFSSESFCQSSQPCPVDSKPTFCYRKQCYETSSLLAQDLGLSQKDYTVSFQSRLGRKPWIKPYTDHVLPKLREAGVSKLAVICPSFVADCLETLEEIAIRAREDWIKLGGESFVFIPCLNSRPSWVAFAAERIRSLNSRFTE